MIKWFKSLSKESKKNIVMMVLIMIMFIIGIIVRWDYISAELGGLADRYKEMFNR